MAENLPNFSPDLHKECADQKLSKAKKETCIVESRAKRCELSVPLLDENAWGSADFNVPHENGEFTVLENAKRTVVLGKGVKIFRDVGMSFYQVEKGDDKASIRDKLSKFKEFAYLDCANLDENILSFNINGEDLQEGMWIPIPLPKEYRAFDSKMFLDNCKLAVKELRKDKVYGDFVEGILGKISSEELIASVFAVAKTESGGVGLGQFVFHRYEPNHKTFSYSIFHVLMEGAGLRARQNLKMTVGQSLHPKNSAKLFLAYLVEKFFRKKDRVLSVFPIDKNAEKFATHYNGAAWRTYNKKYPQKLKKFYAMALNPQAKPKAKIDLKVEAGVKQIGKATSMMAALASVDKAGLLASVGQRLVFGKAVLAHLKKVYASSVFYPSDLLGVKRDKKGVYAIFVRKGKREVIRMPNSVVAHK